MQPRPHHPPVESPTITPTSGTVDDVDEPPEERDGKKPIRAPDTGDANRDPTDPDSLS